MNKLAKHQELCILQHLIDGCGIRQTGRLCAVNRNTVMNRLLRFGRAAGRESYARLRDLRPRHIQLDEQWTYCGAKTRNLPENHEHPERGDQWIFTALDHDSRLVAHSLVGKRNEATLHEFLAELATRIHRPPDEPNHPNQPKYQPHIQISSDAWHAYHSAVTLAFGHSATYSQIVKDVGQNWPVRRTLAGNIPQESISTANVERFHLSARHFNRRLARKTLCFSKKLRHLQASVALQSLHWNFCWKQARQRQTPATKMGLAPRTWKIEELYELLRR